MTRHRTAFVTILAMVLCIAPVGAQRVTLDGVLAAYVGGDFEVIQRTFVRSIEIQKILHLDKPRELDRWLGLWDRKKAVLLLDFAQTSARVAPQYVFSIVSAGRRYLAQARDSDDFVRLWHRAAAGLLQGASEPARVEEHVTDLPTDARFVLARAIAQERRCWAGRPSIDQPAIRVEGLLAAANVSLPDDVGGTVKSDREAVLRKHSACLRDALSRFEEAAKVEDAAAEARVRGGWILLQDGRAEEAIAWLDQAKPHDDRELDYWHGLFRGRAFSAVGRFEDAAQAYRSALALYPQAQTAGIGLSIALMRLYRTEEADRAARSVRAADVATPDPWLQYPRGDERFAGRWIDSLRTSVR